MITAAIRSRLGRADAVVLDTNVAVLLVVGLTDPRRLATHKRTSHFSRPDFRLAREIADSAAHLTATPHMLAEVSNLLDRWPQAQRHLLERFRTCREVWPKLREVDAGPGNHLFTRLGLTDWGLSVVVRENAILVSTDLALCEAIDSLGGEAIRFNQLRTPD